MKNLCLVKDDFYSIINKSVTIEEEIENYFMKVFVSNGEEEDLYHFFSEKNSKKNEISRIKFFKVENFPDGIFIRFKDNEKVEVHICEMKRKPSNKLLQLSRQLYSGYVHSKLLLKMLDYAESDIVFKYLIFMISDDNRNAAYNSLVDLPKKVTPGETIIEQDDFVNWRDNKVIFKEDEYKFDFQIHKYILNKASYSENYEYEIKL